MDDGQRFDALAACAGTIAAPPNRVAPARGLQVLVGAPGAVALE
jgi:hypothetical protein